jgi:hypothetical protein
MNEWFYARGGQQSGPVTLEQLVELASRGEIGANDLVWNSTMKDWTPAGQVAGIFVAASDPEMPVADPSNPYAAPQSAWNEPALTAGAVLPEITHGSEPLDPSGCVKRGFELAKRHAGTVALVFVVYFAISFAVGMVQAVVDTATGFGQMRFDYAEGRMSTYSQPDKNWPIFLMSRVIIQTFSIFLALGLARIGLNLASGKEVSVGMLFSQGDKLVRAVLASLLFGIMVGIGCLFLIVPGIYLALRYGQYMVAIVDRDMGVMDSLSYSSSITTNNRTNLFLFWLLAMLIGFAGMLACGVGLLIAVPIIWMASMVAYRWMQYGHRAALDHPGTQVPMLSGL